MIHLDDLECGPSVIPSVRAALSWVAARIKLPMPDLMAPEIKALDLKVVEARAHETREAIAIPIVFVGLL